MRLITLLSVVLVPSFTASFQVNPVIVSPKLSQISSISSLNAVTSSSEPTTTVENETERDELLNRERYIATNRFNVRPKKGPRFEKRWATRKSRLSMLEGFRYFQLMRRVSPDDEPNTGIDPFSDDGFGNYVSLTVWQEKKHFDTWRTGEAFREAHGGTSITSFLGAMINAAKLLKGPPKTAFYDGLLQLSAKPDFIPTTVDGWRSIESDTLGKEILPAESFVACNQFFVSPDNAKEFELRWAGRESTLKECEGFVSFGMLRRDTKAKGRGIKPLGEDEPTYLSTTIWKDRASFQKWKESNAFKKSHGSSGKDSDEKSPPKKPLWTKPPIPLFYEGTLVITNEEGP